MKIAQVSISQVMEGTGCMLPKRFLGLCHECNRVMTCPNKQAKAGRVMRLQIRRDRLAKLLSITESQLAQEQSSLPENLSDEKKGI